MYTNIFVSGDDDVFAGNRPQKNQWQQGKGKRGNNKNRKKKGRFSHGGSASGQGAHTQANNKGGGAQTAANARNGGGGAQASSGQGKRRAESLSDPTNKRQRSGNDAEIIPCKPPQSITVSGVGGDSSAHGAIFQEFRLPQLPKFTSDGRTSKASVSLPAAEKPGQFWRLNNLKLSATFRGGDCSTCKTEGGKHDISSHYLYLLGDNTCPALVGGRADCVPTLRVENGDFRMLKEALSAQKRSGFNPPKGSVFAVGLLFHLCRVGCDEYWRHFYDFEEWLSQTFGARAMPFVPPFPEDLPEDCLLTIEQCLMVMRAKYLGDFVGGTDDTFCLWKPLVKVFEDLKCKRAKCVVPPVAMDSERGVVLRGAGKMWPGIPEDFSTSVPLSIEQRFVPELLAYMADRSNPTPHQK